MKTINCRDDSLIENRGMWNTMKQKKRCIVVAQGFYEWLKKNGGKEKIPHYMKRKGGVCVRNFLMSNPVSEWQVRLEGKLSNLLLVNTQNSSVFLSSPPLDAHKLTCRKAINVHGWSMGLRPVRRLRRETLHLHNNHHILEQTTKLPTRPHASNP